MINMTELRKIFREKLEATDNLDSAFIKAAWVAYKVGLSDAKGEPEPCTNSDTWNCKYCRKNKDCPAMDDPRNYGPPAGSKPVKPSPQAECAIIERVVRRFLRGEIEPEDLGKALLTALNPHKR